ncbi:hypothetical protein GOP47_0002849 [Adiantum capillus-veneris]|uniref:CobW C-terminal domain-containing protein n=1 Tax=Adiantum capillus-veneris TaxID=13818 RepID=A0A9D4VCE1_ADICA|nr:hypothetical protein GOP47_0002849 [Adiantum capillus-veneris]
MAAAFKTSLHDVRSAMLARALLPCKPLSGFHCRRSALFFSSAGSSPASTSSSSWGFLSLTPRIGRFPTRNSCACRRRFLSSARSAYQDPVSQSSTDDDRVPVTVITGFLGSGKTTLLNYVLKANHGKRLAVIENEFGEVDIDGSLVAAQQAGQEDIMMLNNGCLCCTVRGDLVRMIVELVNTKKDLFDHILIETTGLANPAPIIETFYMEEELAPHVRLDGVLTLVDAKHAPQHLDEKKPEGVVNEAVQQIAYADRILLNKVDLVTESDLDVLGQRIKAINEMARLKRTKYGEVDLDYVLGIGGFDLERIEKDIMDDKPAKEHEHGHDHICDSTCNHDDHDHHHEKHEHGHAKEEHSKHHHHHHHHAHDSGVGSVSIVCEGTLDLDKINMWLGTLLSENADDIYRCKGVLSVDGIEQRYVFQAVHALFEGGTDRDWQADEKRVNKLVFIGKKLERESLEKGFKECILN